MTVIGGRVDDFQWFGGGSPAEIFVDQLGSDPNWSGVGTQGVVTS